MLAFTGTDKRPSHKAAPRSSRLVAFFTSTADRAMVLKADELIREEHVLENARADGRQNLPETAAAEWSPTEQRVFERVATALRSISDETEKRLREFAAKMERLDLRPFHIRLAERCPAASLEIKKVLLDSRDELVTAFKEERQRYRDLRHFQREHELSRAARYASDFVAPWLWLLLGVVVIAESAVNGVFWGPTSETGLVGGVARALSIAVANILPAILAGRYILPRLGHVRLLIRTCAALGLLAWLAWTLTLNVWVAHWRVASETAMGQEAMRGTLNSFLDAPISGSLASSDAVMLLLAGIVAALIAVIDTFALDDPYAGYGAVDRRHKKALQAYERMKKALRARVMSIADGHAREATTIALAAPERAREATGIMNDATSEAETCERSASAYQRVLESAVRLYRDENTRVRTAAAPAHFATLPALPPADLAVLMRPMAEYRARLIADSEELAVTADQVKTAIHSVAERQLDDLIRLVEQIERDALQEIAVDSTAVVPARKGEQS